MKKNKKEILKSPEIQEIIGFVPHWLVRWGSLTIFFFILTLLGIACLIRYPDTIAGQIILTTDNPPVRVVNTMEGKIIKLLIPDDAQVEKGNIIATLESSLSEDAINILKKIISNANNLSEQDITVEGITFGSIQGEINLLKATIAGYHAKEERKVAAERIHNLESQIVNYRNLLAIKTEQNKIAHLELEDATSRLEIQQNLFETGVISRLSFFEEKELFSSKQKEISDLQSTLIQVNIEINNQSKALFETQYQLEKTTREFELAVDKSITNIKNFIQEWQMNYLIVSPINGKLTYLGALTENEFIEKGAEIFAIIPSDQHYVCLGSFAAQGFGKVKIGQDVRIKLDNFPDFQYGSLPGRIESISPIPNQKQYQVKIKLENNLISTYNKKILFTPEMTGTAEIITEDLTLIKRIFHTLRGLI